MNRSDVTEMILAAKRQKKLSWAKLAAMVGQSKEWSTAALLGQMTLSETQAAVVGAALGLPEEAIAILQEVPYKGSLPTSVPSDPLNVSLSRADQRVRHNAQGPHPRGVRRRHHERHRFPDGHLARTGSQGRSRAHRDEREVLALQDVLRRRALRYEKLSATIMWPSAGGTGRQLHRAQVSSHRPGTSICAKRSGMRTPRAVIASQAPRTSTRPSSPPIRDPRRWRAEAA